MVFGWLQKFTTGKGGKPADCWPFSSGRSAVVVAGALLAIAILCGIALLLTGGEWRDAIALREAEGKGLRVDHFVRWGLWRAAAIDALLALGLLVSWRWWWQKNQPAAEDKTPPATGPSSSWSWWLAVALLVVLAAGIRWPRMDLSLYNDEVAGFSRYIAGSFADGYYDLEDESATAFVEATWLDTLWGNRMANNHGLFSVLARTAYDGWQAMTDGVPGQVHEVPLRVPALLGGLLSIVAVAGLGRAYGLATGGLFAALLLAVHPWHLRYSTEARGYGLLFGLGVLAAWCLVEALREDNSGSSGVRNRRRWWLGYAICQWGFLWANIGGVYLAAGINGAVLLGLVVRSFRKGKIKAVLNDGSLQCLIVANVLSAMLLMPLLLPALPQVVDAMQRVAVFKAGIPFGFWPDVLSNLTIGMPWYDGDPENRFNPAVLKYASHPATWAGLTVAGICLFIGLVAIVRRGGVAAMVIPGALLGVGLAWLNSFLSDTTLLPWYVVFVLPFVALCSGCGIAAVSAWIARLVSRRENFMLPRYIGYALVAVILWAGYPALSSYQVIGKQSFRDVITEIRGGTYPYEGAAEIHPMVAGWWTEAGVYDPRLRLVWQVEQLERLIERSRAEQRPLYFILGQRETAVAENAAVVEMLEESGQFELLKIYPGLEQRSYREYLFRLREIPSGDDRPKQPVLGSSSVAEGESLLL